MSADPDIRPSTLAPGLHFVATPIGSARDITLRALDVLAAADVLAAEDTRTLRRLMEIHGVALNGRRVLAYHDHNGAAMRPKLLELLAKGRSVAYASEAGTPLVADPGFDLARAAVEAGVPVTTAPGPSAATAALTVAGLPSDRFLFAGFAPTGQSARQAWLRDVDGCAATLVIYESPRRIHRLLEDIVEICGPDRKMAICRELTKKFEEVFRGEARDLLTELKDRGLKGEVVVVLDRDRRAPDTESLEDALRSALKDMSLKDAATAVARSLGLPRRQVYQAALALDKPERDKPQ